MEDAVKPTCVHPSRLAYLEREIAEISAIYTRLFANRQVNLVLYEGEDPQWGAPFIVEGDMVFHPPNVTPDFLGHVSLPAPFAEAAPVTVGVCVPRPPTPAEERQTEAAWAPPRKLAALFGLAPLVYERLRYMTEMRRKRKSGFRHRWESLPRGEGMPALTRVQEPEQGGRRPAILIGFHWLEVGGAEKLAFDTVKWALAANLRVFVVAAVPALQRLAHRLPEHEDVTFIRLDRYLAHDRWPQFLGNLVRQENIRLVHNHHCVPLYAALAHLRVVAPWLRVIDSTHIVEYADGGYPRVAGVWSNYVDIHHVISRELIGFFRDRFHVMEKVRLGRMLTRHKTGADDLGAQVASLPPLRFKSGQKALHVAFVGRLYYQKRPIVVVEALRAIAAWARKNGVEFRATMVGEGPFAAVLGRLLARYGLADVVTLEPGDTDVPALLRRADILLLPSNNEGLALVCYEAIEQGCIPISTDVGAQDEIVPPELLLPLEPGAALRRIVAIIDRLWRDEGFVAEQQAALHSRYQSLMADPTAEEVLMPIYRAAAKGENF